MKKFSNEEIEKHRSTLVLFGGGPLPIDPRMRNMFLDAETMIAQLKSERDEARERAANYRDEYVGVVTQRGDYSTKEQMSFRKEAKLPWESTAKPSWEKTDDDGEG